MSLDVAFVYVGDYGQTAVSHKTLRAYGLKEFPIDRRSSTQRRNLSILEDALKVLQRHAWLMNDDLLSV